MKTACSSAGTTSEGKPDPINILNDGVTEFYNAAKAISEASLMVDVAVLRFSNTCEIVRDFRPIERETAPHLELMPDGGEVRLGRAVLQGLKLLDAHKKDCKNAGVRYARPTLVIMTGGKLADSADLETAKEVSELVQQRKILVLAIAIEESTDTEALGNFSPLLPGLRLPGFRFATFFEWNSRGPYIRTENPETTKLFVEQVKNWPDL